MERLKQAWKYWMNLDMGLWLERIPPRQGLILSYIVAVMGAAILVGAGYDALDLRHPTYSDNHYKEPVWVRIPTGCALVIGGVACAIFVIHGVRDELKQFAAKLKRGEVKNPFRHSKDRPKSGDPE